MTVKATSQFLIHHYNSCFYNSTSLTIVGLSGMSCKEPMKAGVYTTAPGAIHHLSAKVMEESILWLVKIIISSISDQYRQIMSIGEVLYYCVFVLLVGSLFDKTKYFLVTVTV